MELELVKETTLLTETVWALLLPANNDLIQKDQCRGSGPAFIWLAWIRIRNADPDPEAWK